MPEKISRATARDAAIASHDQPREPEVDQRQQGDNKGGQNPATQPQHDEPATPEQAKGQGPSQA